MQGPGIETGERREHPMARTSLFSTYRQGENRVTASVLAVFERIDMDIVGRLLSTAAGEQSLPFVTFANQIVDKTHSAIPDAMISASFTYLFEVKTTRDVVDREQLKRHLAHLIGSTKCELLFVLTPDVTRPEPTMNLDKRIVWFNFHALSESIKEVLTDPSVVVSEQSRMLLRELQSLFVLDGLLLDDEDTVLVAARVAYPMYLQYSAYCVPGGAWIQARLASHRILHG